LVSVAHIAAWIDVYYGKWNAGGVKRFRGHSYVFSYT